ncbi:OmpH family outer membrane protein [Mucilaginibacter ginkgonis]|uniref:OmpH family outer membrane protein n=1 Tax=Mucilaginibacter ginkgonis TaxID=2682091 RepID=A0A6I4I0V9_9SPHI|nr:OmpH family outer membrane protein [Mucilaginibacter ginkgonis]QQL48474.1 OmpH family outer membrane protein [Mucilaginibacter ginkgonis]
MKKLLKVVLVAGFVLLAGNFAKAQSKVGYLSFNAIVDQMPETKTLQKQVQDYQQQFITVLQGMQTELQTKGAAFESEQAKMTDAVRTQRTSELQELQKRIQDYQNQASQKVQDKSAELGKPLFDKVRGAIAGVAKEKGYTLVIDTSAGEPLYSQPTDDLSAAVKLKLGLK